MSRGIRNELESMPAPKTIAFVISIVLCCALIERAAHAQAWVGFEGNSLTLGTDYTYAPSDRVIESEFNGELLFVSADVSNHSVALSAEYTVIPKLAFSVTVPILTTHYTLPAEGEDPGFPAHGRYDDGNYHTVLQDLRVIGRYMVLFEPLAVTPHLGFSMPMTNYETVGYAGAGRGLKQLHLGINAGKYFTSGVPNLYVHGSYEFSLVERYETPFPETAEYGQNKSDVKGLIGYFITDDIEVNLGVDWRKPHGGLNFVDFNNDGVTEVVRDHHDGLLRESFLIAGLGASYQVNERFRVFAVTRFWITGENTRDVNVFGAGLTYDVL